MKWPNLYNIFMIWRYKHLGPNTFMVILAGVIGLGVGLIAISLKKGVHLLFEISQHSPQNIVWLSPLLGIFLTAWFADFVLKEKLGHGISQVLYAIIKKSAIIPASRMYSRYVTSILTVGLGGSVGLEAPIVSTGSAVGSNIGRFFHLDFKKRTLLIACGSAAGISAIFNSPVAGVIFAIEVILADIHISKFIPILVASGIGSLVSMSMGSADILFQFELLHPFVLEDTGYFILLGVCAGLVALYFTRVTFWVERIVSKIKNILWRALVGGIIVSFLAFLLKPLYGEGYFFVLQLLNNSEFQWKISILNTTLTYHSGFFLFLVVLFKPIATALTIGSGGSGGIFGPSLVTGAFTGFGIYWILTNLFSIEQIDSTHFILVGMCGVFSGVLHAPLTAIFLIAEITGGYGLFIPLMLVSAIAYSTASFFEKHSIYTKHLSEKGEIVVSNKDQKLLNQLDIEKLIETDLIPVFPETTLHEMVTIVQNSKRNIFPVITKDRILMGTVTLDDIKGDLFNESIRSQKNIAMYAQPHPESIEISEDMESAMIKFEVTQSWNLPVVEKGRYVGFLSKSRIFNTYREYLIEENQL